MSKRPLMVVTSRQLPASFPFDALPGTVELITARTRDDLHAAVKRADVLYSGYVPDNIPHQTPTLQWIQVPNAGVNNLRDRPVWRSEITITSGRGIHTVPMAEHLFAMLLALVRQLPAFFAAQEHAEWVHDAGMSQLHLGEIRGKTMGIVGWGKIGDGVAHLAQAFGMRVIGTRWSVVVPREITRGNGRAYVDPMLAEACDLAPDIVYPAAQLLHVLAESDVVVLILPLTTETRASFRCAEFDSMKRGALFFNIGRGPVVDEAALVDALSSGRLAGAGLDVFAEEPLPATSPLWNLPRVIISPHVGGMSDRTEERAARLFATNLARYVQGRPLINVVERDRGY